MSERSKLIREGFVIVVSILLAFAIDAGWDELQDRSQEREVLESLRDDFRANLDEAVATVATHERNSRLLARAHARTRAETLALDSDSARATLQAFAMPRTFDAVLGTLDALVGAGRLGLIRDAELRRELTVFLNFVADSQEDAGYLADSARRVWDAQIRVGGPWRGSVATIRMEGECEAAVPPSSCFVDWEEWGYLPLGTAEDLAAALADRDLVGQVRQSQIIVSRYTAEVRRIEVQIRRVLELLERNLR